MNGDKIWTPDSLIFKHPDMKRELGHLTDRTKAIVLFVNYFMIHNLSCIPIWTSFYRSSNKNSVHFWLRGADASRRVIDISGYVKQRNLTKEEAEIIVRIVNKTFPYGRKSHKTCLYHLE